jgi:hypothetical protein
MLGDFFRINMPYGMRRNEQGEWTFFNREYMPLGWNSKDHEINGEKIQYPFSQFPIFTKYNSLGEKTLLKLSHSGEESARRDENGEIDQLWFYNDGTNPQSFPEYWNDYTSKLKILSKCVQKLEYA